MSTGRLLTLLRHLPREGAFLASPDEPAQPVAKRQGTVADLAAAFGMKLPKGGA